jgi:sugar/nucleoside kinase (ribokinase family)
MNLSLLESLKYANTAAALSCSKIGGRTSIPEKAKIDEAFQYNYQK